MVNLDLKDAPIREAIKDVCDQAKAKVTIDEDVPKDVLAGMKIHLVSRVDEVLPLVLEAPPPPPPPPPASVPEEEDAAEP